MSDQFDLAGAKPKDGLLLGLLIAVIGINLVSSNWPYLVPFVGQGSSSLAASNPLSMKASAQIGNPDATERAVLEDNLDQEASEDGIESDIPPTSSELSNEVVAAVGGDSGADLGVDDYEFDLRNLSANDRTAFVQGDGTIRVDKPLFSGTQQLGVLKVSIDQNARLFVTASEIKAVMEEDQTIRNRLAPMNDSSLVSFQRLRELGVNLRYEPITDRIVLQED